MWVGLHPAAGTVYKQHSSAHALCHPAPQAEPSPDWRPPPQWMQMSGDRTSPLWQGSRAKKVHSVMIFKGETKLLCITGPQWTPRVKGCTLKPATSLLSQASELFGACFTSKLFPAIIMSSCDSPSWQDRHHHYLCITKEAQRSQALSKVTELSTVGCEPTSSGFRCLHTNAFGSSTILPPFSLYWQKSTLSLSSLRAECVTLVQSWTGVQ